MKKTSLVTLLFTIGLLLGSPSPAQADPGRGNFGEHVSSCAQTMGFGADMNPGMHHGASGWDGLPC